MRRNRVPPRRLGVGITYSSGVEPLLAEPGLVQVLEVEPQALWVRGPATQPYRVDEAALRHVRALPCKKIVHGVGFPVGGSRPPDPAHRPLFARMCRELGAAWATEHLNFNLAHGPDGPFYAGFLLPPRQTPDGVEAATARIRTVAEEISVPFGFETGVNYLRPRRDEMRDGEFVAAIAERADCGILLDLHNLWANERNRRQTVDEFLEEIPRDRVWEVHLAGGEESDGYWLDAHSGPVPQKLARMAARVLPRLPNLRALIFEMFPAYLPRVGLARVRRQLKELRKIWDSTVAKAQAPGRDPDPIPWKSPRRRKPGRWTPRAWEDALAALVVGRPVRGRLSVQLARDPGLNVYRRLVATFRASSLVGTLPLAMNLLRARFGAKGLERVLHRFWRESTPKLFPSEEAETFRHFSDRAALDAPFLFEILGFEISVIRALLDGRARRVVFTADPRAVLSAAARRQVPPHSPAGRFEMLVTAAEAARWTGVRRPSWLPNH